MMAFQLGAPQLLAMTTMPEAVVLQLREEYSVKRWFLNCMRLMRYDSNPEHLQASKCVNVSPLTHSFQARHA